MVRTYSCISVAEAGVVGKNLLLTTKVLRIVSILENLVNFYRLRSQTLLMHANQQNFRNRVNFWKYDFQDPLIMSIKKWK